MQTETHADLAAIHTPVLAGLCGDLFEPALDTKNGVMIDGTLGMGGHAQYFLERFENLRIIGIDRDADARAIASQRLRDFGERITIVDGTYDQMSAIAQELLADPVDAVFLDIGVSSLQLDSAERGFSYVHDAPLDMRMDRSQGFTAAQLLDAIDAGELATILRLWGDERFASRIATAVLDARAQGALETTAQLAQVVKDSIPAAARRTGGNPAKRTFQALRIAVNDELRILADTIPVALELLRVGGRLVIESYHSGEDKIVKAALRHGIQPDVPPELPLIPSDLRPFLVDLVGGAVKADDQESQDNPRSASVRLRAVEKSREIPLWYRKKIEKTRFRSLRSLESLRGIDRKSTDAQRSKE
ncbi:MAG: 16S rRNA (cytosine(1402)-N(4))-methyltransferase RsmH [Actinomycetaceae bacterium]|nr:16S rRNA (cytosine(1402)-N(4))-methyltransferase RsmH [Actinomycetaceae bacterium]